jgi:uncharacterized cupredoxin-like copper-binding protein
MSRAGYGFAFAAAVLALVASMVGVVLHLASRAGVAGSSRITGTPPSSCGAPTNLPGTTVGVTVVDMGMSPMMGGRAPMRLRTSAGSVASGPVTFVVTNRGSRTHELVVLPLADGQQAGSRTPGSGGTVDEAASLAEASTTCGSGTGEGITSGGVGWVAVTLPAGRYELVCNEPDHYAAGMWQELDVG